ncbi:hypothetical protein [Herbidospora daliensis]|uniref:hypothetical protein n=1 Tax=Herbidospora daliensis TaxID=295585 RepID=UPI000780AA33|nr:hypothetical protein [Herbidospora daliensis]
MHDDPGWPGLDPARHPFTWNPGDETDIARLVPAAGASWEDTWRFVDEVTDLLVSRYGPWVFAWSWSVTGVGGGGIVTEWCCVNHSVGEPDETAAKVVAALHEWRDWLEELAERFGRLAPPSHATAEERSWHLERAAVRLVTLVVDRTGAEAGWHGQCRRVLKWFLASAGVDRREAETVVESAVGGRFESWVEPRRTVVDAVGEDLAVEVTGHRPYRDH